MDKELGTLQTREQRGNMVEVEHRTMLLVGKQDNLLGIPPLWLVEVEEEPFLLLQLVLRREQ